MDRIGTLILLGALYIITSFVDLKWVLSYIEYPPQLKSRRYSILSDRHRLTLPHMSIGTILNTFRRVTVAYASHPGQEPVYRIVSGWAICAMKSSKSS